MHPSIRGIAYAFPAESRSVRELAAEGALESDPAVLEGFGFARVHVAGEESPYALAHAAASRVLAEAAADPSTVGLLVYAGAPGAVAFAPATSAADAAAGLCTTDRFRFPACRLQYELGLGGAAVLALDQLACTSLFGAVVSEETIRKTNCASGSPSVLRVSVPVSCAEESNV